MKRILPIDEKPYFQVFSYHTYPDAVVRSTLPKDCLAARIQVKDFHSFVWSKQMEELTEQISGDSLELYCGTHAVRMNGCFYREALEEDEIEIVIKEQCYSNVWGAINVFFTKASQENLLDDDSYLFRLGNFNKSGRYLRYQNRDIVKDVWKQELPIKLHIRRKGRVLTASYALENQEEVLMHEQVLGHDIEDQKFVFGFEIKLGDHSYYEWLYTNYIQITGFVDSSIKKMDFYWLPSKDWNRYFRNVYFDYNLENQQSIKTYGFTYLDYVKKNLDCGRYIELWANQYFVRERQEYRQTDHFHQNLIYGYDDEVGELKMMGFYQGKPMCQTMRYEDFESDRNYSERYPLWIVYHLNPDSAGYELNIPYIVHMLKEYVEGVDSSQCTAQIVRKESAVYGMKVYDDFLTQKGIDGILDDPRASQLLYEHKKCMRDRVKYLVHCGYLPEWTEEQMQQMEEIYQTSQNLRNLIVKYMIMKIPNARMQCARLLARLKSLEEQLYPELIMQLSKW